ncbi:MAG TPA: YciI family protein [Gaiellaceae bacterium]|jgi:hypothetical protein
MQYALLIYGEERVWEGRSQAEESAVMEEYGRLGDALRGQSKLIRGEELQPVATATTVQVRGGDAVVTDGPFADTKEVLGGFFLIEADSLDEAIEWAGRIPDAKVGTIEVRPLVDHSGNGA